MLINYVMILDLYFKILKIKNTKRKPLVYQNVYFLTNSKKKINNHPSTNSYITHSYTPYTHPFKLHSFDTQTLIFTKKKKIN